MRVAIPCIVLLATVLGVTRTLAEEKRCYASWSEAAAVVRQEKLVAVEQLSRHADTRLGGSIVKATLCAVGQRYVYRLVVRLPGGLMRFFSLDARKPFER